MIGAANSRAASWVPASGFKTAVRSKLADLCRLFSLASSFQEGWEPANAELDMGGRLPDGSPNVAARTTKNKVPPATRPSAAANRLTENGGAAEAVLIGGLLHPRLRDETGRPGGLPPLRPVPGVPQGESCLARCLAIGVHLADVTLGRKSFITQRPNSHFS